MPLANLDTIRETNPIAAAITADAITFLLTNFVKQAKTANCKSLTLNLCINYGGRDEIVHAVNAAVASGVPVDEKSFKNYFYNPFLPELDLVVRTGGEVRLSNFMLFDAAYAELYFSDVMWPDFGEEEFEKMLFSYQNRVRKFGDIK